MFPIVDIDNQNGLVLLTNYFNAKYFFEALGDIRIDRSRKGYHLNIFVEMAPYTVLQVRSYFKDDEQRLFHDYIRFIYGKTYLMNIAYDKKGNYPKEIGINPLHAPFKNSHIPPIKIKENVKQEKA